MKSQLLIFTVLCAALVNNTALAENPDRCGWSGNGGGDSKRVYNLTAPSALDLRRVPIGSVMAASANINVHSDSNQATCANGPLYRMVYSVDQKALVEGYTDVYKSGLAGVGIRVVNTISAPGGSIPLVFEFPRRGYATMARGLRIDFVRTARDVAQGDVLMDLKIQYHLNEWNAAEINVVGTTKLESQNYFSGCAGVESLNISMGRIPIVDLAKNQQHPFNLDVLCSGMAAGTRVPVKVYFEGSSDGPGRLNLDSGGAQGVEISLLNDRGARLPFSQGGALDMTWIRSEPQGEIYRLPVVAAYERKASQKVEPGRANATLNYILEYN